MKMNHQDFNNYLQLNHFIKRIASGTSDIS